LIAAAFDDMARARGDGLHPLLRALHEAARRREADPKIVDLGQMLGRPAQAGPDPDRTTR
jgi:hypothetical protein